MIDGDLQICSQTLVLSTENKKTYYLPEPYRTRLKNNGWGLWAIRMPRYFSNNLNIDAKMVKTVKILY